MMRFLAIPATQHRQNTPILSCVIYRYSRGKAMYNKSGSFVKNIVWKISVIFLRIVLLVRHNSEIFKCFR
jgi:hypothetical protein